MDKNIRTLVQKPAMPEGVKILIQELIRNWSPKNEGGTPGQYRAFRELSLLEQRLLVQYFYDNRSDIEGTILPFFHAQHRNSPQINSIGSISARKDPAEFVKAFRVLLDDIISKGSHGETVGSKVMQFGKDVYATIVSLYGTGR